MFGVASMLCRLGVRPRSTSPLASQAVGNYMAVLAYVSYETEGLVCSYASDPILTLGAMKVWYGLRNALEEFILPQFETLVLNESLDIGGVEEVVARIVLLLAMDKCVLGTTSWKFRGQFLPVSSFLEMLGATQMGVRIPGMLPANADLVDSFHSWLTGWDGWQMGFTHFVQLRVEPDENTLWFLLGRRAAGIFPRNKRSGADLLIPIFRKVSNDGVGTDPEKISLMLVKVKPDCDLSKFGLERLLLSFVFGSGESSEKSQTEQGRGNSLSEKPIRDVIRISMNMQDRNQNQRFVYAAGDGDCTGSDTKEAAAASSDFGFTLCFQSVSKKTFTFLTEGVACRLRSLLKPAWDPMVAVIGDLEHRRDEEKRKAGDLFTPKLSQAMTDKKLMMIASRGLLDPPGLKPNTAKPAREFPRDA